MIDLDRSSKPGKQLNGKPISRHCYLKCNYLAKEKVIVIFVGCLNGIWSNPLAEKPDYIVLKHSWRKESFSPHGEEAVCLFGFDKKTISWKKLYFILFFGFFPLTDISPMKEGKARGATSPEASWLRFPAVVYNRNITLLPIKWSLVGHLNPIDLSPHMRCFYQRSSMHVSIRGLLSNQRPSPCLRHPVY